jgi:hypothetical protein
MDIDLLMSNTPTFYLLVIKMIFWIDSNEKLFGKGLLNSIPKLMDSPDKSLVKQEMSHKPHLEPCQGVPLNNISPEIRTEIYF